MAINFPDSPSNGDTHTANGVVYTYNSTSTLWDTISGGSGGSSVTEYANLATFPSSDNTVGDFGFATDTKAVYVWDGTEWDRVYTDANAVPEWTTAPPATADLAIDGTATNQTVVASDPEGFPIEYSYDTNPSNQAQATISQSSNAFTITPSTVEANSGSFTLRYKATDGLHSTSRSTTYTLEFTTPMNVSTGGSGSRMDINANSSISMEFMLFVENECLGVSSQLDAFSAKS